MSLTKVIISKDALLHNLRQFKKNMPGTAVLCVVKSEAYGHGLSLVAKAIAKEADLFGTANLDEALKLRESDVKNPILVLSYYDLKEVRKAVAAGISLVAYSVGQINAISRACQTLGKRAKVHLKIDTGTSRLGVLPKDFNIFAKGAAAHKNVEVEGIMSHFSSSEEDITYTEKQLRLFNEACRVLESIGSVPRYKHIACSAAGIVVPDSRLNLMRLGIGLYGLWPSALARKTARFSLKPALSWKTTVVQVKDLPSGSFVGYGKTFKTSGPVKLAVLPVGYFDGYDRKLGNRGHVLIRGKICPVIGRICMNLMMVDATRAKGVKPGDEAVLLGKQGQAEVTAENLAEAANTINYEFVSRINPQIIRKIV